jgi:phage terminase large subunit GpA-like protein
MNYQEILNEVIAPLWAPPPNLLPSAWAEEYRYLSSESSASAGKWHNKEIPYVTGILDAIKEPGIDSVVIMCAAQLLKTEVLLNLLGYFIHLDPCPIMVVQPTIDIGESFSRERVAPMIRDTPVLTPLVATPGSKSSGNTILKKSFPGGQVVIAGGNSAASLSSRPIRILLADEIDRWPEALGKDGDPLLQAERRTAAFFNKLRVYTSTPTKKGNSRIEDKLEISDKRVCLVPCPNCGSMQRLVWDRLRWDKSKTGLHLPETARYHCADCEEAIDEKFKTRMLRQFKWEKTAESRNVAGFYGLNSLYSPWSTWPEMVEAWLEAQGKPEQLRAFINLVLGESWEEQSEKMAADTDLSVRAEPFDHQQRLDDTLIFTAGIDVQADRLECVVVGWNVRQGMQCYESLIFPGDTAVEPEPEGEIWLEQQNPYREAAVYLKKTYGEKLALTVLDSGYNTSFVHRNAPRYFGPFGAHGYAAIKGDGGAGKPVVSQIRYSGKYKSPFYLIGVDGLKDALQARLLANNGSIRFSKTLPEEFYSQLTAEQVFSSTRKGFVAREWRKVRTRNEALDCVIMAWAGVYILHPDWAILEAEHRKREGKETLEPERNIRPERVRSARNFATDWR